MTTLLIFGLVLFAIGLIWLMICYGNSEYDDTFSFFPMWILIIGTILLAVAASVSQDKIGYKKGQIDYHNGIIKYELKTQADSTVVWEEIKPNDK